MAQVDDLPRTRRLILDSGGVIALSRGSGDARAALDRARRDGFIVAIPTPVIAEVHRGGRDHALIDRIINAVDVAIPTSEATARLAGALQAVAGLADAVDAIVAAEALNAAPSVILTSDPDDIRRLLEGQAESPRVVVIRV